MKEITLRPLAGLLLASVLTATVSGYLTATELTAPATGIHSGTELLQSPLATARKLTTRDNVQEIIIKDVRARSEQENPLNTK